LGADRVNRFQARAAHDSDQQTPFRLIPDAADHFLIMDVPARSDYSGTFALSPGASDVAFIKGPLGAPSSARLEIEFYRIRIRGPGVVQRQ
jgi:hypothetical protein